MSFHPKFPRAKEFTLTRAASGNTTTVRGYFAPDHSTELPMGVYAAGVVIQAKLYLLPDSAVPAVTDTVEVAGRTWQVDGSPNVWQGTGLVVNLKRV